MNPDPNPPGAGAAFRIANMDCAAEEAEIRRAVSGIADIRGLFFRLGERTLRIDAPEPALERALAAIRQAGFDPQPVLAEAPPARHGLAEGWPRLAVALLLALAAESLALWAPPGAPATLAGMALAAVAIGLSGWSVYGKGWAALRQGRLNMNALMTVAVTGAFAIGEWPEAAMVMVLFALAEAIEAHAVDRARDAIRGLLALVPERAETRQADGGWLRLPTRQVPVGAVVRLRPGERVPLDGVVTRGQSAVNQAPVTGESLPVDKAPGDEVFAGSINQTAELELRVTAPASDSTVARIIHTVQQAQGVRAPTQRFVDRFAAIYTPTVFALALVVAVATPWLLGWPWPQALYKALVLLVIACPCALVISTPVTVVSGLAAATRRGILIKGGVYLEQARRLKAMALDKTGTLTHGRPRLVAFEPLAAELDPQQLARIARGLAARSDHPVSQAIARGLTGEPMEVTEVAVAAGRGVQGVVAGQPHVLANHRWIEERGQCTPALQAQLARHEQHGHGVTLLADVSRVLAVCVVADTLKPTSQAALRQLKALGVTPVMLSGDHLTAARAVAAQAGIEEVHGDLLPEEKLALIGQLQSRLGTTGMAGDGINDAPALARADIGFAMGAAGTHAAMEAADVVIMNDDLRRVPETILLSRRTHAVLWQNISLALGIKAVFLFLALSGGATMWMAVFADMGASLLVVFNGLRLLRAEPDRR